MKYLFKPAYNIFDITMWTLSSMFLILGRWEISILIMLSIVPVSAYFEIKYWK